MDIQCIMRIMDASFRTRRIIELSLHEIDRRALNAMVLVKRHGNKLASYGVVAQAFREKAVHLKEAAAPLQQSVAPLVRVQMRILQHGRLPSMFRRTAERCGERPRAAQSSVKSEVNWQHNIAAEEAEGISDPASAGGNCHPAAGRYRRAGIRGHQWTHRGCALGAERCAADARFPRNGPCGRQGSRCDLEISRQNWRRYCMKAAPVFEAGNHRWWVLYDQDERRVIDSNVYIVESNGQSAILDPGGLRDLPAGSGSRSGSCAADVRHQGVCVPSGSGYSVQPAFVERMQSKDSVAHAQPVGRLYPALWSAGCGAYRHSR